MTIDKRSVAVYFANVLTRSRHYQKALNLNTIKNNINIHGGSFLDPLKR